MGKTGGAGSAESRWSGVVAAGSFLLARGIYAEDHRVPGPNGSPLGVGDRWPCMTDDTGMAAIVESREDEVKVLSFLNGLTRRS